MSKLTQRFRAAAALAAAVLVAAGLAVTDVHRPVTAEATATAAAVCQPGRFCANAYPDPSGYGTIGDLATADVIVVGDSIANGCRNEIRTALTQYGITSAVNYWSGRPTTQGVAWALSLSRKPPVLVMELGSNDYTNPAVMTGEIARLRAGLPPDTVVVWVDTYNGNQLLATGWINQQIWASGVMVAPWYQMFAKAPWRDAYYLRDRLHPSTGVNGQPGLGCAFLADAVDNTIAAAYGVWQKRTGAVKPK
jgi:hypothetical protein